MGCVGQAFNRGQECDEKEWTGRLMCAYPIEAREHRLLPRFLWWGGIFVGMEGGVQNYRAQGLSQLILIVPKSG